jgi:hypothetical protein
MELTRPELCSVSHKVVIGEVVNLHTQFTGSDNRSIERIVQVVVEDAVMGPIGKRVEVVLPGGMIGDQGHWVEDVPKLMVNGRYLLFIATAMDGKDKIVGGDQGAVRITAEGSRVGETLAEATASVEVCRAQD